MELLARLQDDMKLAMKSGQKDRLSVIRMLINDVKNIDLAPKPTTAQEAVAAYGKKLRKGIEEYEKLGRPQEAAQMRSELAVVEEYLPKKATPEQTEQWVKDFLASQPFTQKDLGRAMGAFMKIHGQEVEAGVVNQTLKRLLS